MRTIGVDTHKATLAACAIDELGSPVAEASFGNDPAGHRTFIGWARSIAPEATIGIEGSSSFGAPLARSAQLAGLRVREVGPVPATEGEMAGRGCGKAADAAARESFYVVAGGAAAVLTGLIFVAV